MIFVESHVRLSVFYLQLSDFVFKWISFLDTKHDHDGLFRTLQRLLRGVFSGMVSMVTCTKSVDGFTEHIVSRGRCNIFGHL